MSSVIPACGVPRGARAVGLLRVLLRSTGILSSTATRQWLCQTELREYAVSFVVTYLSKKNSYIMVTESIDSHARTLSRITLRR